MNVTLTPFEKSQLNLLALASGLYSDYLFQSLFPVLENLKQQRREAFENGNYELAEQLRGVEHMIEAQIPVSVIEA
jgi:hypothetical protein